MTQVREPLNIIDGGPPTIAYSIKAKTRRPIKTLMFMFILIYTVSIVVTAFFTYNLTSWAQSITNVLPREYQCNRSRFEIYTNTLNDLQTEKPTTPSIETVKIKITNNDQDVLDLRLPKTIIPNKYDIKLIPFIYEGNFTFRGEIEIDANITGTSDNITLHAADLDVYSHNISVLKEGMVHNLIVMNCSHDSKREFYIMQLNKNLTAGFVLKMKLKFVGFLNDNLHGFYRSSYDLKNTTRWIAATQFQATDARRAFPCFDEPALKATFKISIAHPKNMSALSNMNPEGFENNVKDLPDYMWTHFKESLPMSTYLVAFVVSDFANKSVGNFTVWARESAIESASYALDIGPKILAYFEDFYQIKYPLPKMDMIALPDFNAGAMENWGLMTFRETAMLYDGGVTARVNKPRIATVIAHELAHQWFGNLVTPSWWSDLWLNEGFASYVEYVGIDAVEKSWKSMDLFVIHEIQNVFALDALSSSHQIVVEVNNPNEINEIFDRISYGKGASIIRMMDHFLTSEVFNRGIANYLNNKKYQSATQMDLWEALTNQARKDGVFDANMSVATIMNTWTLQTGYPVVNVTRDYKKNSISFHQERFLLVLRQNKTQNVTDSRWWIPITFTGRSKANFKSTKPVIWMKEERDVEINNVAIPENDWIIVNIQQTGFYRVNYDEHNWKLIIAHLNNPSIFEDIPPANRAQILDDALNLALAGKLSYKLALDVTKYLVHEREFVPWKAGLLALGYIDGMLAKGPHYLEYKKYILSLIKGLFDEVGFNDNPNDSMLTMYKRIDVINIACLLEYDECVLQAVTLFRNYIMTPNPDVHNPISPNLRNVVYCTSVRVGGTTEWNFIWERFLNAQSSSERDVLITALGCTRHPWLLIRYLDHSLRNESAVRKQDTYKVFGSVSNSVIGQPIAFSFLRQNWLRLKNYMGSAASNLNTIVKYSTRKMNSPLELDELKKFAKEYKNDLGRTIDQAIEKTEANIQWMKRNYESIVQWLNENASTR